MEHKKFKEEKRESKKKKSSLTLGRTKSRMPFLQVLSLALRAGGAGKVHNSPVNGWLVSLQRGLQLDTSSPNSSPVSRAGFQGCGVLQALPRVTDFKGELKLF